MKNISKAILMATVLGSSTVATVAIAKEPIVNQGAFHRTVTVKEALTLRDDTNVQLKGYIVKAIGDEKYEFKDRTGSITVDIDDDLWYGRTISAKTPVTIIGEVDVDYKPMKRVEIDVDAVIIDE
ncbi:NirD/YgiW/YdeI family stress tolerance protein [Acinetobacter equi]|uniref:Uncharacterized protein n=1 Tax=Acinetobacter equi TaxID=1324350 RepID=A0A0N9W2N4_9GAMM|nr:NirD/YgiW/YdeI family stress tolerance protein [Acinetobacter equi]ALH95850.1 hypothetical protein AOY20_10095 [Acinetobacter equi]